MSNKLLIILIIFFIFILIGLDNYIFSIPDDMVPSTIHPAEQNPLPPIHDIVLDKKKTNEPKLENNEHHVSTPPENNPTVQWPSYGPSTDNNPYLDVQGGYVTLHVEKKSLKRVLEDLARESGVQINAQLVVDRPLSIHLVHVPLSHALQTILEFEDSFFAFENQGKANIALKTVWLLPAGSGGTWLPKTPACSQELSKIETQLHAEQSSQRAEALEALIDLQGPDVLQAVVQSLEDQDDDVRYRALLKAHIAGLTLPPEVLTKLIQYDNFDKVRMMALEAVGNHPSIDEQDKITSAQYAINDSSPAVQTRAGEILSQIELGPLIRKQEQDLYEMIKQSSTLAIP